MFERSRVHSSVSNGECSKVREYIWWSCGRGRAWGRNRENQRLTRTMFLTIYGRTQIQIPLGCSVLVQTMSYNQGIPFCLGIASTSMLPCVSMSSYRSADFQLASLQLNFMKRGYSEERAYTLAKLRMRNELRKKLRNLHLYERARLQKDPYDDSTRIFDVWQTQLKDTVADVKRMRPTLCVASFMFLSLCKLRRA